MRLNSCLLTILCACLFTSAASAQTKVFKGQNKGKECIVSVKYEAAGKITKVTSVRVQGTVSWRDSSDFYGDLTTFDGYTDFSYSTATGLRSSFISRPMSFEEGQTRGKAEWIQSDYGDQLQEARFSPSILAPTSVSLKKTDSTLWVFGGWTWFTCSEMSELNELEAQPFLK